MPLGDNGHHLKAVPTTDEKHIPKDDRELRRLTRDREGYVNDMTREKNKIHHALESCGIKLSSVLADVFGKSGLDLLNSLLAGVSIEEIIEGIPMKRIRKKLIR